MIAPAIAQTMIAPITISRKFTWMPGSVEAKPLTPMCRPSSPLTPVKWSDAHQPTVSAPNA